MATTPTFQIKCTEVQLRYKNREILIKFLIISYNWLSFVRPGHSAVALDVFSVKRKSPLQVLKYSSSAPELQKPNRELFKTPASTLQLLLENKICCMFFFL